MAALALAGLVGAAVSCGGSTDGAAAGEPRPTATAPVTASDRTVVAPPATDPSPVPVTVAVVGDSITEWGQGALRDDLGGDWDLSIDGRAGFRVAEQLPAAAELAAADPGQVVVNLGTNDVLQGRSPASAVEDLARMVELFPGARCIHLVTVNERMVAGRGDLTTPARAVNDGIRRLADDDERITVVDWAATIDADASGGGRDPLVYDTVHPTERGDHVLAGLYADALAACRG